MDLTLYPKTDTSRETSEEKARMFDRFQEIIHELGVAINLPLFVDKDRACGLEIDNSMQVHIQIDDISHQILISSLIAEVPAGRYREDLLKEALKSNSHFPRTAILAYAAEPNQLVAFEHLSLSQLTGDKLATFLGQFVTFIQGWQKAIASGRPGPNPSSISSNRPPSLFGL